MYRHERTWTAQDAAVKPLCEVLPPSDPVYWPTVAEYLANRGLDPSVAQYNGWYASVRAGDSYLRVVCPCASKDSSNHFWQARLVEVVEGVPRYQSPHGRRRGDAVIFVVPLSWPRAKGTVLVEGPMDALAGACVGYVGIGWMGMNPTDDMLAAARVYSVEPRFVVADQGDEAERAASRVWQHFPGARLIRPYPFKDLADAPAAAREELLT